MKLFRRKRWRTRLRFALLPDVFKKVRAQQLTYLSPEKIVSLYDSLRGVRRRRVPGDFAEFGIALGGSAIAIAKQLDGTRRFLGFDVFGMIPPPSERDGADAQARYAEIRSGQSPGLGGNAYYGYIDDLYQRVVEKFQTFGLPVDGRRICLVAGLFEDTLNFTSDQQFAFLHIDCDWYDPVKTCLDRTFPHLSNGAIIVIDDYNDYGGCRLATDAFLRAHKDVKLVATKPHAILRWR